jgi:hypothetical protein
MGKIVGAQCELTPFTLRRTDDNQMIEVSL